MRAKEDVFEPINAVLEEPKARGWRWGWRSRREDSGPDNSADRAVGDRVPGKRAHDEMLQLVQRIFLAPSTSSPKRVVFCGIDRNNSSGVCASAGRVLAEQTGSTVCLVDANIGESRLSKLFGLAGWAPGSGKLGPWREQCVYVGDHLFVASSALLARSDGELAPSSEIRERILALSHSFEYLLFDAPGANRSPDAALLGQVAGSVVLVLEAKSTHKMDARKAKERLEMANVHVLGTVLHNN